MKNFELILKRFVHQKTLKHVKNTNPNNFWGKINLAPRDPIISINQLYGQDPNPKKINLSIGTYRTEDNKSFIFPTIRKAEKIIFKESSKYDKEYSPMEGYSLFNQEAFHLLFGPFSNSFEKTSITVQTLAGTGAIDLAAAFLGKFFEGRKQVFISNPSWINHYLIFRNYNFETKSYRYYDNQNQSFDSIGFFQDIERIPDHSVVIFQACGHNPSATSLTPEQWQMVSKIVRYKNLLPLFDIAYHGLCSGDIEQDVYPIRLFAEDGHLMLVTQSFSKNMGIYSDRVGSLTILCDSEEETYRVQSQMKNVIISKYICPPSQMARVVSTILCDPNLKAEWQQELIKISGRLQSIRQRLRNKLEVSCPSHCWKSITEQSGIFWYSGLTSAHVEKLINDHNIYLCEDGRINISGLNSKNIDQFVAVVRDVLEQKSKK